jgi:hypothetical protein
MNGGFAPIPVIHELIGIFFEVLSVND